MDYFDETEIRKTIATITPDRMFEVRIVKGKKASCGYFKNVDNLINQLRRQDLKGTNVYIVPNPIKEACYSREQREKFLSVDVVGTGDLDVRGRDWILIDIDPIRPTKTSASAEEITYAWKKAERVKRFLTETGFEKPILAFSGNGAHLLYKIEMRCSKENTALLKKFLEALAELFDDDMAKIDTVNFNESRGCKLYGTMAQKGLDDEIRRHRMSKIIEMPDVIKPTDKAYFEKVCNIIKHEEDKPSKYNGYGGSFDIEEWMQKYGISYKKTSYAQGGTKFLLECCPFDETHKSPDAMISKSANGAIGFHCFHNSCSDKAWKDVRIIYEPDAYTRKWEETERESYKSFNRDTKPLPLPPKGEKPFYEPIEILKMPSPKAEFIRTGIKVVDRYVWGLEKGTTSVWSGLRASAKSTLLTGVCLNAINSGNCVAMFSGELREKRALRWVIQQAAGKAHVEPGGREGEYNVPRDCQFEIGQWLTGKFYLYNNQYGRQFERLQQEVEKLIDEKKADLVLLDNLMAIDIDRLNDSKWDAQTKFVLSLHDMAVKHNVHIAFVAHPRKAKGFLRFDDIAGTADIGNAVDSAFIMHRVNADFKRLFAEDYGADMLETFDDATNIVEIVKDRNNGTQDVFVPMWYEVESKRLKNEKAEYLHYGWETDKPKDDGFVETDENPFA